MEFDLEMQNKFAEKFMSELFPDFNKYKNHFNYLRAFKKLIRSLEPIEKKWFYKTPFFSYEYNLINRLRSVVTNYQKGYGIKHTPFTIKELIIHIESQFEPWMSWDNWGEWHIDHIIPRNEYKKTKDKSIFELKNMRPLKAKLNLKKGSKIYG